jgi:hypothetical protein
VRVFVCICGARMSVCGGCAYVFGSGGGGMCVSGYTYGEQKIEQCTMYI